MSKEWTDDEVRAEIAEAIKIVREDRFEQFVRSKIGPVGGNSEPTEPKAPPRGEPKDAPTDKKKRSLWWGEDLNQE